VRAAAGLLVLLAALGGAPPPTARGSEDPGFTLWEEGRVAGRPVAVRLGAAPAPPGAVACRRCHGAEAEGGGEGGIRAPALVRRGTRIPGLDAPALARALSRGIGLDGRDLHPAMPRYELEPAILGALLAELDRRARRSVEGVEPRLLRFATIWPAAPTLEPLRALVERYRTRLAEEGGLVHRELELLLLPSDPASALSVLERRSALALLLDDAPPELLGVLRRRGLPELFPLRPQIGPEPASVRRLGTPRVVEARILLDALIEDLNGRGRIAIVGEPELVESLAPALAGQPDLVRTGGPGLDALLLLAPSVGLEARRLYAPVDLFARLAGSLPAGTEVVVVTDPRALPPGSPEPSPRARALLGDPASASPLLRHATAALLLLETALRRLGRDVTRARLLSALDELGLVTTGLVPPWSARPGPEAGAALVRFDRRTGERRIEPSRRPAEPAAASPTED
jgi:hypothetical protein